MDSPASASFRTTSAAGATTAAETRCTSRCGRSTAATPTCAWGGYRQSQEAGGHVRKGERTAPPSSMSSGGRPLRPSVRGARACSIQDRSARSVRSTSPPLGRPALPSTSTHPTAPALNSSPELSPRSDAGCYSSHRGHGNRLSRIVSTRSDQVPTRDLFRGTGFARRCPPRGPWSTGVSRSNSSKAFRHATAVPRVHGRPTDVQQPSGPVRDVSERPIDTAS